MALLKILKTLEKSQEKTAVALGIFNGVHSAHQQIINTTVSHRRLSNLMPTVFTFNANSVFPNKLDAKVILTDKIKLEVLHRHGIEQVYMTKFEDVRGLTPREFFEKIIVDKLNAKALFCGYNYTFGKDAKGTTDELMDFCDEYGIELEIANPYKKNGVLVSSTVIRECLREEGNMKFVNELLGYTYFIKTPVVHGLKLGRTIGFPTINQTFDDNQVIPKFGVYRTVLYIGDEIYKGLTNVGVKPTIDGERKPLAETYIIGLNRDLYGELVVVAFLERLRDEEKFNNLEELKDAIKADLQR